MTSYVTNGLIAYFNPNNSSSYSGSGATITSLVGSGITGTLGGTYSSSNGTIRLTNSPPFTLTALNQTIRQWAEMTTLGNDVYASVWGGDIYKQTGGTGNFVALNQTSRNWFGMTTLGNDIYATDFQGDIYKQTNGTGNFVALNQTKRDWRGMTTLGNDVYACVQYNGDIYKQTNGTGNFVALGQGNRQWFDMTTRGTDVYACVYGGDIYKQTNGTGNFVALNQTNRGWHGLTTLGNDVYACVFGGDIYVQYGGTGNFIALGQVSGSYTQMTTLGNKIYISVQNGDIYTFNPSSKLDISSLSNIRTVSIWMYLHSANDTPWRYLIDARTGASNGYIANKEAGSDWSGSTYYLNDGDVYDLTTANIQSFLLVTGQWVNITIISNSAFTDDITLFGRYVGYEGLDCSFGPIMIYNRAITRAEQIQNFYASEHNYLRIDPQIGISINTSYTYGTAVGSGYAGSDTVVLNNLVVSNSPGALSFSASNASPVGCASIVSSNLVFTQAGTVTIGVTQAAAPGYNAVTTPITFNVVLSKTAPTISGATTKSFTYGTSATGYNGTTAVDLTALGISSNSSGTLSYTEYADTNNAGTVSSNTLTFSKGDTVTIQVNQTAGNFHNALSALVTFDVVLAKIAPTISGATTKSFTYGTSATGYNGTTAVDLTALGISSNSSGTLSYTEYADINNAGTVSSNTLTFSKTDTVTIQVNQTVGNFHDALSVTVTFDVVLAKGNQIITFNDNLSNKTYGDSNFNLTASSNSGLNISYSSSDPTVASISGNTVTILKAGSTTITASQAGNDNYNSATSVDQTLTINKASQTVSFSSATNTFNETSIGATFALSNRATSSTSLINSIQYSLANNSGIATISGSNIVIQGGGVFTLRASQSSSTNYEASNIAEQTITVYLAQNVEFSSILSFGSDLVGSTIPLSGLATSSSSSTNPVQYELVNTSSNIATISGSSLVISGSGLITLRAYQNAGGYYNATTTQNLNQWSYLSESISSVSSDETGNFVIRGYSGANPPLVEYSTDKGNTWSVLNVPYVYLQGEIPYTYPVTHVYSNNTATVLTVTTINYIYISRDSGLTWTTYASPGAPNSCSKVITNGNGTKILAINGLSNDYIYLSVDSGTSWNAIASAQDWNDICTNADFTVFSACTLKNVFVSLNGGINWTQRTPSDSPLTRNYRRIACSSSGARIYVTSTIGVSNTNGNLFYSANYGLNWRTKGVATSWYGIACDATGRIVIAGDYKTAGNIWTSFDGGDNWIMRSVWDNNVTVQRFTEMYCSRNGKVLFGTSFTSAKLYRSFNTSKSIIPERSEQLLSFTLPPTISYGTTINLSASSTSGLSDFLFSSFDSSVATIVIPRNLSRTVSPTLVTQGVGSVNIAVYQDGNDTYLPASSTVQTTIVQATPTISGATAKTFTYGTSATGYDGSTTVDLTALGITSNSDGTLSFTEYSDTENCGTVANNILTFSKAGTIIIRVNQTSTALYTDLSSLSVTFTVTLSKTAPTISGATTKTFFYGTSGSGYDGIATVDLTTVGVSSDSSGTLSYTEYADSNNIGSVSSNILTISNAGTVKIQVNQTAGIFHNALSSTVTFDIVFPRFSPTTFLRSKLNLWDESRTKRFRIQQNINSTIFALNENTLNITDGLGTVIDIVSLLIRVDPIHAQINSVEISQTVPTEDYVKSLSTRASILEDNIASQGSLIIRAQDSIISLSTRAGLYEENVTSQASLISRAQESIISLSSRASLHEENIASQGSLAVRALDSLTSLSTRAGLYEENVASQGSLVIRALDSLTSLSARASLHEVGIASQGSLAVRALDSLTSLSARAGLYEENVASQGSLTIRALDSLTSLSIRASLHEIGIASQGSLAVRALDSIISLSTRASLHEIGIASQGSLTIRALDSLTSLSTRAGLYEENVASQGSLIIRAQDSIISLSTRAGLYEENVASQGSLIIRALDSLISLSTRASLHEVGIASQGSLAIRALDSLTSLSTRASLHEVGIASQGSLIIRALDSLTSLSTRAGLHEIGIASQGSLAVRALDSLSSLSTRASLHEIGIASQGSLAIRALNSITSLSTRMSAIESNITTEDSRMDEVENDLNISKNVLYAIFDGNQSDTNYSTLQLITTTINADPNSFSIEQIQSRLDYITSVIERLTDSQE